MKKVSILCYILFLAILAFTDIKSQDGNNKKKEEVKYDKADLDYYLNAKNDSLKFLAASIHQEIIFSNKRNYTCGSKVVVPPNRKLVFLEGAILDVDTLQGNNTFLEAGNYQILKSSIELKGSFVIESVEPEWFGAKGDGRTDDKPAIDKADELAGISSGKKVKLQSKSYLLGSSLSIKNSLVGSGVNNTFLKIERDMYNIVYSAGNYDEWYKLSKDAYRNQGFVSCSSKKLLRSLSVGDIIHIQSDKQSNMDQSTDIGEMHIVQSVSGNKIYFADFIFDSAYLIKDNAKVAKLNPVNITIKDLTIYSTELQKNVRGIYIYGALNPIIENVRIYNTNSRGLVLYHCYNPKVRGLDVNFTNKVGTGYCLYLGGATMHSDIQMIGNGARHCITTGGDTIIGGVTWNNRIHHSTFIQTQQKNYCIGTHQGSGSVYIDNCMIRAGINTANQNEMKGLWNKNTNYKKGDKIICIDGWMAYSLRDQSGNDPLRDDGANWKFGTFNQDAAIQLTGGEMYVSNCYIEGFKYVSAIKDVGLSIKNFQLTNIHCVNNMILFRIGGSNVILDNFVLKDIRFESSHYSSNYAIQFGASSTLKRYEIGDLQVENRPLIRWEKNHGSLYNTFYNLKCYKTDRFQKDKDYAIRMDSDIDKVSFHNLQLSNVYSGIRNQADTLIVSGLECDVFDSFLRDYRNESTLFEIEGTIRFRASSTVRILEDYDETVETLKLKINAFTRGSYINITYTQPPKNFIDMGSYFSPYGRFNKENLPEVSPVHIYESNKLPSKPRQKMIIDYNDTLRYFNGTKWIKLF